VEPIRGTSEPGDPAWWETPGRAGCEQNRGASPTANSRVCVCVCVCVCVWWRGGCAMDQSGQRGAESILCRVLIVGEAEPDPLVTLAADYAKTGN
jgi:hypothetical protein